MGLDQATGLLGQHPSVVCHPGAPGADPAAAAAWITPATPGLLQVKTGYGVSALGVAILGEPLPLRCAGPPADWEDSGQCCLGVSADLCSLYRFWTLPAHGPSWRWRSTEPYPVSWLVAVTPA